MATETKTRDLTAQVNGTTTVFSTPDVYVPGTLVVYANGMRIADGCFAEINVVSFSVTLPKGPLRVSDKLSVQYEVDALATIYPIIVPYAVRPPGV